MRVRNKTAISIAAAVLALQAIPTAAQDLERPAGWMTRFDMADMSEADVEMFVEMPPGWHVTTGPAGIFWHPDNSATGDYRAELEVFLFDPAGRREAFGLFVGGADLQADNQRYTYFLIRNGGQYIIKNRAGAEAPTVEPWTSHDAILSYEDRSDGASVKNVLALEARGDEVRFFVNGAEVARTPRAEITTDGTFGFRVNHGLNLHISRLEVTPLER